MLTKRLIACFDVVNGRVTKAQQFQDNIDVGIILAESDSLRGRVDPGADGRLVERPEGAAQVGARARGIGIGPENGRQPLAVVGMRAHRQPGQQRQRLARFELDRLTGQLNVDVAKETDGESVHGLVVTRERVVLRM